jgi:hypothetical protein
MVPPFGPSGFKGVKDWNALFADANFGSGPSDKGEPRHAPPPSRPPADPPPALSRPGTGERTFRRASSLGKQHTRRASGAPPPSPSPHGDADPAIDELKQQWNWGFNHRRRSVTCMVCGREVEPGALDGHLKLCSAGGKHHAPAHTRSGKQRTGLRAGDGGGKDDPLTRGATRHDPDYRNGGLHKKKWAGVLDEGDEEEGPGLLPEYDAARGGIRLKLYTGFSQEEHFFPSEGGALGGGAFGKGPWSRFPASGASSDRSAHMGNDFWAKHESRRRAQDAEFEQVIHA